MTPLLEGTPTDTGPIVASLLPGDSHYAMMNALTPTIEFPLVTTSACLSETFHFLGKGGGRPAQMMLWDYIIAETIIVADADAEDTERAHAFMTKYAFCDYADATLLGLAEKARVRRILTFDSHFFAYRLSGGRTLEMVLLPSP